MTKLKAALALLPLLTACAVGPDYKRPDMEMPENWVATPQTDALKANSTEVQWWHLYNDAVLNQIEDEALKHNSDIQVAAARVLEIGAQLGVSRADLFPTVSANLGATRSKYSLENATPYPSTLPRTQSVYMGTLNASYELDLWGKFRRATEAARADLLSAESARETVRLSLTTQVAQQYFALLSLNGQEQAVKRLVESRQERFEIGKKQLSVGVISEYDFHQIEADIAAAQSQLAALVQARSKQETTLSLLLGRSPREIMNNSAVPRGTPNLPTATVPEGLPSDLLLRRPDLRDAENKLIALNARIGVARAMYFPSLSLTGYAGGQSTSFSNLFNSSANVFQFAANITEPIFNAGRVGYLVDAAEARRDQALIQYKQAVANAFGDVRNALSAQEASKQILSFETTRSNALATSLKQAELRFKAGVSSRLELLDIERNFLQAQLTRLDAERSQRSAVADLFKAMGGGWQEASAATPQPQ